MMELTQTLIGTMGCLAVCSLAATGAAQTAGTGGLPSSAAASARVLVVPFENARDEPRFHWLSEAAAVLLTDGLRAGSSGAIVRSQRVRAFEQLDLPVSASLSRATIIKVGQLVGAADVVVGSYRVDGTTLSVTARSIRLDAGRLQPEVTERGDLKDLFAIFERLAGRLGRGGSPPAGPPHPPLGAFENYVKGLLAESPLSQSEFLEAALREAPSFDRARLALWGVRTEEADHSGALEVVRAVVKTSPSWFDAQFCAGISLIELKRYDEALGVLKALVEFPPAASSATAAVLNNMGVLVLRRGSTPLTGSAAYYLTKATDADADPDYMFNLGYAYASDRNYQGALYWLREALRRDPADVDAHYVLAVALNATGNAVESARERDLARRLSSRYGELDRRAAENRTQVPPGLERMRLDTEGSWASRADQTIVNSAQREQRELATFHLEQGRRLFEREQDREALAELRKAIYLSPYEAQAHLLIGRIHLRGGHPADAVDAFKISIWSEDQAPAHVYLAEAFLKMGDAANAKAEAQRALALDPGSADAKRLLSAIK
jgi:Tfp pilus assembly protein PilF/TolB-like protein